VADTVTRTASPQVPLLGEHDVSVAPRVGSPRTAPDTGVRPTRASWVVRAGRRVLAWPAWAQVLTVYLLSRVVATGVIELVALTAQNPAGVRDLHPGYGDLAVVWDGQWYEQIAEQGYPDGLPLTDTGRVDYNSWAFFPLFPAVVRLVMVTGLPFVAAATVVNLLAAAGAVLLLRQLLAYRGPRVPAAPGWLTPVATKRPIFTVTGGCAADSPAISAIVTVRVHMSNDTRPWLAFAPVSRTAAKAASTSLAICRWT